MNVVSHCNDAANCREDLPAVPSLTTDPSYVITELLQSDLHKIIVSPQHLTADHIKVFLYQILRGKLNSPCVHTCTVKHLFTYHLISLLFTSQNYKFVSETQGCLGECRFKITLNTLSYLRSTTFVQDVCS